ncbi:hypothetical protein ACJJIQ_16545 [Microbulbifer sp. ANSA003]|uniref:hypothetical protein n=1 Tax=Microbulbifer sp. ANSA003 TaxID=3243360 RepID=UPI004042E126
MAPKLFLNSGSEEFKFNVGEWPTPTAMAYQEVTAFIGYLIVNVSASTPSTYWGTNGKTETEA